MVYQRINIDDQLTIDPLEISRLGGWATFAAFISYIALTKNISSSIPVNLTIGSVSAYTASKTPIIKEIVNFLGMAVGGTATMVVEETINLPRTISTTPKKLENLISSTITNFPRQRRPTCNTKQEYTHFQNL